MKDARIKNKKIKFDNKWLIKFKSKEDLLNLLTKIFLDINCWYHLGV